MSINKTLRPHLQKLVDAGTLSFEQAIAAQDALLGESTEIHGHSKRTIISEVMAYVGGAIIVLSSAFLLSQAWHLLGKWGRPGTLAGASAALFIAATFLTTKATSDSFRRLSSTLFMGSAAVAAFSSGLFLNELWLKENMINNDLGTNPEPWKIPIVIGTCASISGAIAFYGYQRARSALAVLVQIIAANVLLFTPFWWLWIVQFDNDHFPKYGSAVLIALGLFWIFLTERKYFHERNASALGAIVTLFMGLQSLRQYTTETGISIILIAGGLFFIFIYIRGRMWPYLTAGLITLMMGGITLMSLYVKGMGAALGSLLLGIAALTTGIILYREKK